METRCFISRRIAGGLLALFLLSVPLVLFAQGAWVKRTPDPVERTEVAVASLEGKIYVIGGFRRFLFPVVTGLVEVYDPAEDTWKEATSLPEALHHAGVAGVKGKLYVVGGFRGLVSWDAVNKVYEYDPAKNAWSEKAPMPTARGALALAVRDNKIYAIGGRSGGRDEAGRLGKRGQRGLQALEVSFSSACDNSIDSRAESGWHY